jgi:hypothetical protein
MFQLAYRRDIADVIFNGGFGGQCVYRDGRMSGKHR